MKVFKTGIIVGRFQHIHKGHEKIIKIGLDLCDKLLIYISSYSEFGTKRNPFSGEFRRKLIYEVYKEEVDSGRIILSPLEDLTNENDLTPNWGRHVLNTSKEIFGTFPSVIIYGKDKNIRKCFYLEDVENVTEVFVDRNTIDISATKIREMLLKDDRKKWEANVNPKIYKYYDEIKNTLEAINLDK